jgi:hypothetical protein
VKIFFPFLWTNSPQIFALPNDKGLSCLFGELPQEFGPGQTNLTIGTAEKGELQ